MDLTLRKDALAETYLDSLEKLKALLRNIKKKYDRPGFDLEELESESLVQFVRAYDTYKPDKGSFESWMWFRVGKCLLEKIRSAAYRHNRLPRSYPELETIPEDRLDINQILNEVSQDAALVMGLVLSPPPDITMGLWQRGKSTPNNWRAAIHEFLQDLGWAQSRIHESFQEIQEALG